MSQRKMLMGNQAMALGALRAGVRFVSGYPGTPSTEVLETCAKERGQQVYVEWSVNEKAALEFGGGAAMAGGYSLVTMKQVGLNACADPAMTLSYVGIKGALVLLVADDPGPISSQTEQDTRRFAGYSKIPVLDPSSVQEAYEMMAEAFALSHELGMPVILRPTTRICHGCADVELKEDLPVCPEISLEKGGRWVIFPKSSYQNHIRLEELNRRYAQILSGSPFNELRGEGKRLVVASGVSYAYALEALETLRAEAKLLKIATPYPFPEGLALRALQGVEEALVLEELDPVVEDALQQLCGKAGLSVRIHGKRSGDLPFAGEYGVELAQEALGAFLGLVRPKAEALPPAPPLPVRPPVLCAGCPHRASFYAVKKAMEGKKSAFCGDIGCYTLGNAQPLDMVDTCLCMGAGITQAQGIKRADPDIHAFAFVGDSTFFHSGITGVVNAVYNQHKITLIVLDNSTTAMTGHQPHPGIGKTMMGEVSAKVSIEALLRAIGVETVLTVDPLRLPQAIEAVRQADEAPGVSAVIFRSPCIAVTKPGRPLRVKDSCIGCQRCIREIGCPALFLRDGKAAVDPGLCVGCGLCKSLCPVKAIEEE